MKKFTDKLNESLNDTSSKTKQMLDYLKNSIKTIDASIQDYENKSITEEELKTKLKKILQDNIEEEEVCLQEISRKSKKGLNESVSNIEITTDSILSEFNPVFFEDGQNSTGTSYSIEDVKEAMIKFAKLHVKAALEAAAENAYCDIIHPPDDEYPELEESETMVIKSSILDAYPESNIK